MTLSFSQKWPERMGELAGQPNYFIEKIWNGLIDSAKGDIMGYIDFSCQHVNKFGYGWHKSFGIPSKLHTIREDKRNRWEDGNKIHFQINPRSPRQFQFAPVVKCVNTQYISISYPDDYPVVFIGNTEESAMPFYYENPKYYEEAYGIDQMKQLAINDGFPSVEDFFKYFDKDFAGKIIHWTDLKY